jgi:hypothetical protein
MDDSERMDLVDAELAAICHTWFDQHLIECEADDYVVEIAGLTSPDNCDQVDIILHARAVLALRAEVAQLRADLGKARR